MIQAIGLTSNARKESPPAVDDVSFDAPAGHVTALLGARRSGKTTAVRLMLELQQGRGVTYFRGRPLHRIPHPAREVGVLLGDVPGHPARTVRGHLRMLCSAAGVPVLRADEVLEVVGLVSLRDQRLGTLSRGMDRRLGLACALLADPHTLVLDDPAAGLSTREGRWLHSVLRAHAELGGTVLFTTNDAREAARVADRVVTLDAGRVVADQDVADFARTRLRPRVAVRSPHAARFGVLLAKEARTARRSVEVVPEGGNRLSVYGSTCADVGDIAFRHGILVHQLADEIGDAGPSVAMSRAADDPAEAGGDAHATAGHATSGADTRTATATATAATTATGSAAPGADAASATPPATGGAAPGAYPARATPPATEIAAPGPDTTAAAPAATAPEAAAPGADPARAISSATGSAAPGTDEATAATPVTETAPGADVATAATPTTDTAAAHRDDAPPEDEPGTNPDTKPDAKPDTGPATKSDAGPDAPVNTPAAATVLNPQPATSTFVPLPGAAWPPAAQRRVASNGRPSEGVTARPTTATLPQLPPPITVRTARGPLRPVRYELRRATGIATGYVTTAFVLVVSALLSVLLARVGHTPQPCLLAAWPQELPLPPAALGAGLLGAFAFGEEFRHPALAADRGTVPRRLGLLAAKLVVGAATALLLGVLTVVCDAALLHLVYGSELTQVPADWLSLSASWLALLVGCAWAGVLAAGLFRSTSAGLAAVVAVPIIIVPLVQKALEGPSVRTAAGLPARLRDLAPVDWPFGIERLVAAGVRMIAQPVGGALTLSLGALLCAYLLTALRTRVR